MSAQQHQSGPTILDRRNLENDHRCLAGVLSAGMSVLDVGCGTGAITQGIADAVGPTGIVVGVDRDSALIERARAHCSQRPNLRFEEGDATKLNFESSFDVVTAARTLQWIADLDAAIRNMARAAKSGGLIVVLDYNHALNEWQPSPPERFIVFYDAFLSWRRANGWNNEIANQLPELFEQAGLKDIRSYEQNCESTRGEFDFAEKTSLWTEVIDKVGPRLEDAGYCDASAVNAARHDYEVWRKTLLVRQTLSMRAVVARVPAT